LVGHRDDGVDQRAGDANIGRPQRPSADDMGNLGDHASTVVVCGHSQCQRVAEDGLVLERQVAVFVGGGRPDDRAVDG
jgi:hypothetical protein